MIGFCGEMATTYLGVPAAIFTVHLGNVRSVDKDVGAVNPPSLRIAISLACRLALGKEVSIRRRLSYFIFIVHPSLARNRSLRLLCTAMFLESSVRHYIFLLAPCF